MFTEQFGKISALAKGARRQKSPFESALDLLAICRVVFIHKQSDSLDLLTEAKLEQRFRAGTVDLRRLYAGYYILELLDSLTDKSDQTPGLFEASIEAVRGLDSGLSARMCSTWWETQMLRSLGQFPELDYCVECGKPAADKVSEQLAEEFDPSHNSAGCAQETVVFGLLAGGVLCRECKSGQRHLLRVSQRTIQTLKLFAAAERLRNVIEIWQGEPEQAGDANTWQQVIGSELRGLMNQYLWHLVGHKPRMHSFLGTVLT